MFSDFYQEENIVVWSVNKSNEVLNGKIGYVRFYTTKKI